MEIKTEKMINKITLKEIAVEFEERKQRTDRAIAILQNFGNIVPIKYFDQRDFNVEYGESWYSGLEVKLCYVPNTQNLVGEIKKYNVGESVKVEIPLEERAVQGLIILGGLDSERLFRAIEFYITLAEVSQGLLKIAENIEKLNSNRNKIEYMADIGKGICLQKNFNGILSLETPKWFQFRLCIDNLFDEKIVKNQIVNVENFLGNFCEIYAEPMQVMEMAKDCHGLEYLHVMSRLKRGILDLDELYEGKSINYEKKQEIANILLETINSYLKQNWGEKYD